MQSNKTILLLRVVNVDKIKERSKKKGVLGYKFSYLLCTFKGINVVLFINSRSKEADMYLGSCFPVPLLSGQRLPKPNSVAVYPEQTGCRKDALT